MNHETYRLIFAVLLSPIIILPIAARADADAERVALLIKKRM